MTTTPLSLETLLPAGVDDASRHLELFALLTLGVLDAMQAGVLTEEAARDQFFTGENCLFTKRTLRHPDVDSIMSRGVQLPDLFEALPPDIAVQESRGELAEMRAACLRLLDAQRRVA
jgi:hypothetical protein